MRAPIEWLNEYCAPQMTPAKLANRLAMTGTEVERVEHHGVDALEYFVVGKVLDRHQHPDADRLSVCMVDVGGSSAQQIVCGAPNVKAGQTVAVAKPGAVMPDGTKLDRRKLRGQESNGMILAEDEVGIGTEHAGIMVFEDDSLKPGTPLTEVLPIATDVLVLEITQNRPDCLGIYGIAREVHGATGAPLKPPPWNQDPGSDGPVEGIEIDVECPELCPRFTARVFENVTIGPSPRWLKARLMAAGQRPISNVVDITNYVMLLTGQPLHAFDLDRIAGRKLTVRRARSNEPVDTLDGQTRTLDEEMLLIADADGPTSIAGVMGGARSEVSDTTTKVVMEAANWVGPNVHRTGLKLGLRSEASSRFEKGLQPEQAMEAQAVATQLMLELTGATLRPGTIDIGGDGPPLQTIRLRDARIEGLLGTPIPRERSEAILKAIGFDTAPAQDGLDVTVPAFRRADVTREADLIEEVARLDGLERLSPTLPATRHSVQNGTGVPGFGALTQRQKLRRRASDALVAQGLDEIVGWSFTGPDKVARLRLDAQRAVELENPMSSDQAQLRTTLLGSLLDVLALNRARGAQTLKLFEAGAVYLPRDDGALPNEPYHVSAVLTGDAKPRGWRTGEAPKADFFTAKSALQGLLDAIRAPFTVQSGGEPFLHPARSATVHIDGRAVGWVGEVHPLVAASWEIDDVVAGFEIDLDAIPIAPAPLYTDLTSFPEVREDLAVVVADTITAAQVLETTRAAGRPLLAAAEVFDVYRDAERIGAGNVSLALRLAFRAADRTLTDAEVAAQRVAIVQALESQLQGRIRA
jgi:phenylalanyl-tRNA synthetase beta chain